MATTTVKKVVRKQKVAATPADAPAPVVEVAPTPVPTPVEEVAPVVEAAPAPAATEVTPAKPVVVAISAARVRAHLDKMNLNKQLSALLAEVKAPLAEFEAAQVTLKKEDATADEKATAQATVDRLAPLVPSLEAKNAALSRERIRFSSDAAVQLSIVLDELVQQLTEHTIKCAIENKKKIIQTEHLHKDGIESLPLYPLICSLPSFQKTRAALAQSARDAAVAAATQAAAEDKASALAKAEREWKKKYHVTTPKVVKTAPAAAAAPAAEDAAAPTPAAEEAAVVPVPKEKKVKAAEDKTSFRFYVGQVCKEMVKRHPEYEKVRISTEIRDYLSNLLVELIQRLAPLVYLTAQNMKIKTINESAVFSTLETILIDGHAAVETIVLKEAQINDTSAHKAELAKREEAKKAGTPYTATPLDKLPKITGLVAERTITYPTSGYAALHKRVLEKFALYKTVHGDAEVPEETA